MVDPAAAAHLADSEEEWVESACFSLQTLFANHRTTGSVGISRTLAADSDSHRHFIVPRRRSLIPVGFGTSPAAHYSGFLLPFIDAILGLVLGTPLQFRSVREDG